MLGQEAGDARWIGINLRVNDLRWTWSIVKRSIDHSLRCEVCSITYPSILCFWFFHKPSPLHLTPDSAWSIGSPGAPWSGQSEKEKYAWCNWLPVIVYDHQCVQYTFINVTSYTVAVLFHKFPIMITPLDFQRCLKKKEEMVVISINRGRSFMSCVGTKSISARCDRRDRSPSEDGHLIWLALLAKSNWYSCDMPHNTSAFISIIHFSGWVFFCHCLLDSQVPYPTILSHLK